MKYEIKLSLPTTGFLRINDVLRFIPVGRSTFWSCVKSGVYPAPIKISRRCVAWEAEKIHALISNLKSGSYLKKENNKCIDTV